jgi:hypothetical protein
MEVSVDISPVSHHISFGMPCECVCVSDLNMEPLNQNASEQQIMEK